MANNMSWWDGVMVNVNKIKDEVAGLNGGKGGNPFPTISTPDMAKLMPKNPQAFPMDTPGVVQDFLNKMPKNPNWNPMAGSPPMKSLGELMPQNPQPFPTVFEGPSFRDRIAATNNGEGPNWGVFKGLINYGNKK